MQNNETIGQVIDEVVEDTKKFATPPAGENVARFWAGLLFQRVPSLMSYYLHIGPYPGDDVLKETAAILLLWLVYSVETFGKNAPKAS